MNISIEKVKIIIQPNVITKYNMQLRKSPAPVVFLPSFQAAVTVVALATAKKPPQGDVASAAAGEGFVFFFFFFSPCPLAISFI